MKKDTIRTIAALAVGVVGSVAGYKLHKKAKKINDETERSMNDAEEYIQKSYAEVVEKARQVDAIKPYEETAEKLKRVFGEQGEDQSE